MRLTTIRRITDDKGFAHIIGEDQDERLWEYEPLVTSDIALADKMLCHIGNNAAATGCYDPSNSPFWTVYSALPSDFDDLNLEVDFD